MGSGSSKQEKRNTAGGNEGKPSRATPEVSHIEVKPQTTVAFVEAENNTPDDITKLHEHMSRLNSTVSELNDKISRWSRNNTRSASGKFSIRSPSFHRPAYYAPEISAILEDPRYNKGTAFTEAERNQYRLKGLLPPKVEDLETQVRRALLQFRSHASPLNKYSYLASLLNTNQTVFYKLLTDNLTEMLPIIYTPTVGEACQKFGNIFHHTLGMYISIDDRADLSAILENWPVAPDIIVVTDGSRILGLGDLGTNGMGIPIGKLSVYVAGAGFHPGKTLPITLDLGTNNQALLTDDLYLGKRKNRVGSQEFFSFMEDFMCAVCYKWPHCLVQFEDFSSENAFALLEKYRDRFFCFNDDIQGTGAVILAGIINAARITKIALPEHKFVFFGAGSAGVGVADMIASYITLVHGVDADAARKQFYFVDTKGLITTHRPNDVLASHKKRFARTDVTTQYTTLVDTVRFVKPTVLLGLSTTQGAFTEEVVKEMAKINERPVIFPLSNPTSKSECTAIQAFEWTDGRVVFASGSPFDPVQLHGRTYIPGQGFLFIYFLYIAWISYKTHLRFDQLPDIKLFSPYLILTSIISHRKQHGE
eukprot:TRINITY_DN165_c0_g2_i9.p1 TRINITY_DN165_c0_g2~~TRINITY_DN165_c0_g2_i9.p1  ORF type:complete len:592 (+),score=84.96 TRINITY_DN165_c0_g2_i9:54-1829(+)